MSASDLVYLCEGSRHELAKIEHVLTENGIAATVRPKQDCRTPS